MKTKIILPSILLLIISLIYLKYEYLERFFVNEKYYNSLVRFGIIKKCHHTPKFIDLFNEEGLDYIKLDKKITSSSLDKLLDVNVKDKFTIPFITHHVYFTPTTKKTKLPTFYIKKMKANFNRMNAESNQWQHFIWTNNPQLFDELNNIQGVVIKDISDFKASALYKYLSNRIELGVKSKVYFMEASDITRMLALQKYGGIYTDIDYEIFNARRLSSLITKYDLIGGRELPNELSFYGNAFVASKPEHPIINQTLELMENYNLHLDEIKNIPSYIKYPCDIYEKLYFRSPPLITLAFLKKNNIEGNNDIILPSWMVYNMNFARKKNGGCEYSNIDKDIFSKATIDNLTKEFKANKNDLMFQEKNNPIINSIYYSSKHKQDFDIIGADMFCGTWSESKENKKLYYWNWPFSLFIKQNEN